MGVSTDALLVYGIALEEGAILVFDEDRGEEAGPSYMAYMGISEGNVSVETHCHSDYPMHLIVAGSAKRAYRGSPLGIARLVAPKGADEELRAFVLNYGLSDAIDKTVNGGKPGWILASYWG